MSDGNGYKIAPITGWVKITARADGSIVVEHPAVNMDNPQNVAAVLDLLAAGISSLCHNRLAKMGEQSRIVPATVVPMAHKKRGRDADV